MDNYNNLIKIIKNNKKNTNFYLIIGKSVNNFPIFAYHYGSFSSPQILMTASTHAREYVSTSVGFELINLNNFSNFGLWYIPLVNPDGVKIVLKNNKKYYKANSNLVDINVNFDANWGQGKSNLKHPNFENYIGPNPNSEIETRSLIEFTKKLKPTLVINLHTKGNVIYYGDFLTKDKKSKDKYVANIISSKIKFPAIKTKNSFGGFSDWCEMKLNIPAITIELGKDNFCHPIELKNSSSITHSIKSLLNIIDKNITSLEQKL